MVCGLELATKELVLACLVCHAESLGRPCIAGCHAFSQVMHGGHAD
jgi:hypothetical protein